MSTVEAKCVNCGHPFLVNFPEPAPSEGLREAAERVIEEYDKTHLTHDVAYEDVAAEIDQLRLVLLGRDHPGLRPEYRAALARQPDTDDR